MKVCQPGSGTTKIKLGTKSCQIRSTLYSGIVGAEEEDSHYRGWWGHCG